MRHKCKQMEQSHEMAYEYGIKMTGIPNHGPAISYVEYAPDLNAWVAHYNEYATVIEYCPFCGIHLRSLL